MKIHPFLKRLIRRPPQKRVVPSDEARIQREIDYEKRLGKVNPQMKRLRERVKLQKRRSYGQK